ncbi:DUF3107 domain-containing protein [Microbacterium halophytorum]|uniref:DUF3107 domain-containing protein n=1 Tax=Microbacterium halophytorum TaxID=2067568 RepID=UPI000CFC2F78|nr:DUF3107 domain-containing protein [Microbacterium halophytorum]
MDIRIGLTNTARELSFESADTADAVKKAIADALAKGTVHIELTDAKGAVYLVPTANIAYVELGAESKRPVGFVN